VRIAKKSDPKRIEELKKKIRDAQYVEEAIQKLAQKLSAELIGQRPH
jgi:anti-sigma28 factor (negative regulator of flagellin synthesis)